MSYAKLFSSITESSLWSEPKEARLLFVTMLAKANSIGFVEASLPGLARAANLSVDETANAVKTLENPDPYSKNPADEGRRILKVEGGWIVLNYEDYRNRQSDEERREYMRDYMRTYRDKFRVVKGECVYCGEKATGVDHVIALASGGDDTEGNQVACCETCNKSKKAYSLPFWLLQANKTYCRADINRAVRNPIVRAVLQAQLASEPESEAVNACKRLLANVNASKEMAYSSASVSESLSLAAKRKQQDIPAALDNEEFRSEWNSFKDHRRRLRAPMTPRAQELLLKILSEQPNRATEALRIAQQRGWKGFEWSWIDTKNHGNTTQRPASAGNNGNRNVGTANEGRASDYAGIGKVV